MTRPFITVEEAIPLPGLRVAFTHGVPGPWGQATREILELKGIDFHPVIQEGGQPNEALKAWTGQTSAPCAMLDDERPRSHWSELIMLAERLAPEPRLVPADEAQRMEMFGILHELCGEDGYGWNNRLIVLDLIEKGGAAGVAEWMRHKFASGTALDHAAMRVVAIMDALTERLEAQRARGSDYLVGNTLSAADIYWMTFSNMLVPFRNEDCPMPDYYRGWIDANREAVGGHVPDILIEHRDLMLKRHIKTPMSC